MTDAASYEPQTGGKHSPGSGAGYVMPPIERLWFKLNDVYNSQFEFEGKSYDCIPKDVDMEEVLEEYYAAMEEAGRVEDD